MISNLCLNHKSRQVKYFCSDLFVFFILRNLPEDLPFGFALGFDGEGNSLFHESAWDTTSIIVGLKILEIRQIL